MPQTDQDGVVEGGRQKRSLTFTVSVGCRRQTKRVKDMQWTTSFYTKLSGSRYHAELRKLNNVLPDADTATNIKIVHNNIILRDDLYHAK